MCSVGLNAYYDVNGCLFALHSLERYSNAYRIVTPTTKRLSFISVVCYANSEVGILAASLLMSLETPGSKVATLGWRGRVSHAMALDRFALYCFLPVMFAKLLGHRSISSSPRPVRLCSTVHNTSVMWTSHLTPLRSRRVYKDVYFAR